MANPFITQGTLNRIRAAVVVPSYTSLNINPSYMGKNFVSVKFSGDFAQLLGTGTGAVPSPEPYVFAEIDIDILRTQSLSESWITQAQATSNLGDLSVHPDTSTFPVLDFQNAVIRDIDPGAFDGQDPVVKLMLHATYVINNNLWNIT